MRLSALSLTLTSINIFKDLSLMEVENSRILSKIHSDAELQKRQFAKKLTLTSKV